MAESRRNAFNFLASYKDIYEILEDKDDKIAYLEAILNKQFYGIEPNMDNFSAMVKMAYVGQKHNLDKAVVGWEKATGLKLNNPHKVIEGKTYNPRRQNENATEEVQVQEKVQEKEEEKEQNKRLGVANLISLEDEFLKKVCNYFSQTKEHLQKNVWSFLNQLKNEKKLEDFKNQTIAYIDFKELSEEKKHSWKNYRYEFQNNELDDFVDKLDKLKKEPPKTNYREPQLKKVFTNR